MFKDIPYKYIPRDYQIPILRSKARYQVLVLHRRSGKTKTALNRQIKRSFEKKGLYLYILPTYKQAKKVIWNDPDMMQHFPKEIIEKKNDTELYIRLRNGSTWILGGSDDPKNWLGTNPIDVVLDEYEEMKEEMWTRVLLPILTENRGTCTFVGTLKGRNHFWQIYQKAKASTDKLLWEAWLMNVNDTHAIPEEDLAEARRTMTDAFYRQEFLCEAIEDASAFFKGIDNVLWNGDLNVSDERFYKVGIDLGKYKDFTVLAPVDRHTLQVGKLARWNQLDWNYQKDKIVSNLKLYKQHEALMDSTGLGDPIYDDLTRIEGINIRPFTFTANSREAILKNLAIKIEQKQIRLPNDPILLDELRSMVYTLNGGKVKIQVPDNMHDDCIMSVALAVWELNNKVPAPKKVSSEYGSELFTDDKGVENVRFNYDSDSEFLDT